MIYTSYFSQIRNFPKEIIPISIAGKAPDWYNGLQYKKLAPKLDFFKVWKETHDNDYYIKCYKKQVLDKLEYTQVIEDLYNLAFGHTGLTNSYICLLCYETPDKFCHRHLVAEWFMRHNVSCRELILDKEKGNLL